MKAPISLTETAAAHIRKLMPTEASGLRLDMKSGGCAGMEYLVDIAAAPGPSDLIVEDKGARVFIPPLAQMFIFGTRIDYVNTLLESGFKFSNPNVTGACGCGESVSFS